MKELYIAPEVKLVCFEASEKIAADLLDEMQGWRTLSDDSTDVASTDIKVTIKS